MCLERFPPALLPLLLSVFLCSAAPLSRRLRFCAGPSDAAPVALLMCTLPCSPTRVDRLRTTKCRRAHSSFATPGPAHQPQRSGTPSAHQYLPERGATPLRSAREHGCRRSRRRTTTSGDPDSEDRGQARARRRRARRARRTRRVRDRPRTLVRGVPRYCRRVVPPRYRIGIRILW